jgi:Cu-Zn family superoxide dismutase
VPYAGFASSEWVDPGASDPIPVHDATAVLVPTKGSHVSGVVRFRESGDALEVTASVDGLAGGAHAYHVHVYGDCSSPDAASAGPHFHFTGSSFDEEVPIITGDLGELRPDDKLTTVHQTRVRASLHGRYSIIGRAVVVHEHGNDPASPPDGGAGKRLACGVIGVSGPVPAAPRTASRP